jgi:hypothetical protein
MSELESTPTDTKLDGVVKDVFSYVLNASEASEFNIEIYMDALPSTLFRQVKALTVFRYLSDKGFGKLLLGRHGHSTRFIWIENPIKLAKNMGCVLDSKFSLPEAKEKSEIITCEFPVRRDLLLKIEFPVNMTEDEKLRFSKFVMLLPTV